MVLEEREGEQDGFELDGFPLWVPDLYILRINEG